MALQAHIPVHTTIQKQPDADTWCLIGIWNKSAAYCSVGRIIYRGTPSRISMYHIQLKLGDRRGGGGGGYVSLKMFSQGFKRSEKGIMRPKRLNASYEAFSRAKHKNEAFHEKEHTQNPPEWSHECPLK